MTPLAVEMLTDINKETVDFRPPMTILGRAHCAASSHPQPAH